MLSQKAEISPRDFRLTFLIARFVCLGGVAEQHRGLGHRFGIAFPDRPDIALTVDQELCVRPGREHTVGPDDIEGPVGHHREQGGR